MLKISKLGDVCKIQSGNSIPVKEKEALYRNVNEGLPYVATKDVGFDGVIDYENGVRIPPNHSSKFRKSKKNSILICAEGGSAGRKIALSNKDCHFVNKLFSISPGSEIDSKYVYYYTLSSNFQKQFKKAMHGLIGGVSLSKIKDFQITYPSFSEQQHIATKLEAAYTEIDKGKKNYDKKKLEINLIKNKFLLTKLSQFKNSKSYTLNDICKKITDGSHNPPKVSEESSYMMLSSKNIFDDNINYERPRFISEQSFYSENKRTDVKKNDVLLTIVGTIGRCAVVKSDDIKFTLQRSVAVFKPNDLVDSRFLMYLLQSLILDFKRRSAGVAQQGIYLKQLKNTKVKIPPLDKQKSLVNDIDNFYKELEELNRIFIKQKSNYESLKLSILSQEIKNIAA